MMNFFSVYSKSDDKDAFYKFLFYIGFMFMFPFLSGMLQASLDKEFDIMLPFRCIGLIIAILFLIQRIRFLNISYLFLIPIVVFEPIVHLLHLLFLLIYKNKFLFKNHKAQVEGNIVNGRQESLHEINKNIAMGSTIQEENQISDSLGFKPIPVQKEDEMNSVVDKAVGKGILSSFWKFEWFSLRISQKGFILWFIIIFPLNLVSVISSFVPSLLLVITYISFIIPGIGTFLILSIPIPFLVIAARLKDAGKSPALALLIFVPYIGSVMRLGLFLYALFLRGSTKK